ncbi:hypothetical protein [Paraburkholderia saeva]|uniref:HTH cro/C1-type domain-containing protein n=1 Tax=Paraburkholderia saeva TaxID=2777537 RepID=A0A9N8RXW4_9BURK|nr:hypothetical protein [Paraburkholderia saeva]CAG4900582.1 hypothetical protein LMG31841_02894 [Paraburkholderia saeva]
MDTWNQRLAYALAQSEYTANGLAAALGLKAPSISAWIGAGSITPARDIKADNLLRVCELLNVRPEWVLFGKLPMARNAAIWPFEGVAREEFESLPERERARITRFMRDTVDAWTETQTSEVRRAG